MRSRKRSPGAPATAIENANLYAEAEQRSRAVLALDHIGEGVFLLDRFGVVRLWNQAADSITGLRANSVMGRRIGSIRTRRTEWAGPAFGLYISRELARRMNGRIGVTSTEGRARPSSASCRWPEAGTAAEVLAHISRSG